jgi:hypothetical protein
VAGSASNSDGCDQYKNGHISCLWEEVMPILHNKNPNRGRESTTVTATVYSHDVYTELYAEETRKQVKLNTVLMQAKKCLHGLTIMASSFFIVCMS